MLLLLVGLGRRGGGGRETVQRFALHGSLFSNFTLGPIGGVLEGVADFAQVKSGDVPVALVVPFRCATSGSELIFRSS